MGRIKYDLTMGGIIINFILSFRTSKTNDKNRSVYEYNEIILTLPFALRAWSFPVMNVPTPLP